MSLNIGESRKKEPTFDSERFLQLEDDFSSDRLAGVENARLAAVDDFEALDLTHSAASVADVGASAVRVNRPNKDWAGK